MTTQEKIDVMQAYLNGATIEGKLRSNGIWIVIPNPDWSWAYAEYRIAYSEKPDAAYLDRTANQIAIMMAYESGKPIQARGIMDTAWIDYSKESEGEYGSPGWNWSTSKYRVKPNTLDKEIYVYMVKDGFMEEPVIEVCDSPVSYYLPNSILAKKVITISIEEGEGL